MSHFMFAIISYKNVKNQMNIFIFELLCIYNTYSSKIDIFQREKNSQSYDCRLKTLQSDHKLVSQCSCG